MAVTTDVAIIGGGVIGASIAYQVAAAGTRVLLVDRGDVAGGDATDNSAAQVRLHHGDVDDARLAAAGFETFENWAEIIGGDCGFRRTGFALLVDSAHVNLLTTMVKTLAELGVDNAAITPDELMDEHPGLVLDGVAAVAYEPRSGYADPVATKRVMVERARAYGAAHTEAPLTAIRREGDRITGVNLGGEMVSAGTVVVAAGAWSAGLLAGIQTGSSTIGELSALPLRPKQIGLCVVDGSALHARLNLCMVIDDVAGIYFRPDGHDGVLFGVALGGRDVPPDEGKTPLAPERIRLARGRVDSRLPGIAAAPQLRTASACDAYTPDGRPVIGPVPGIGNLYLATGFSGNGFKLAPAVGSGVAAEITVGTVRPELEPYRPERFTTGRPTTQPQRYRHM
jgi:glycine/D-amino acid oxidase-like deaminating enzyme